MPKGETYKGHTRASQSGTNAPKNPTKRTGGRDDGTDHGQSRLMQRVSPSKKGTEEKTATAGPVGNVTLQNAKDADAVIDPINGAGTNVLGAKPIKKEK